MNLRFLLKKARAGRGCGNLFRFFPVFLDNCRVFLFSARPRKGPASVVWDITDACNLSCCFCKKAVSGGTVPPLARLTSEEKNRIIDTVADAGVWLLSFCGGEPLLCDDLGPLIRRAKQRGLVVNISTNGALLKSRARELVEAGVDIITVSVDSADPGQFDSMRGREGHFAGVVEGVRAIRELRAVKRVFVEARCLVSRLNCFELEQFVHFWRGRVDAITLKPVYENPAAGYLVPPEFRFKPEEKERVERYFHGLLRKYRFLDSEYHRRIPEFFFSPAGLKEKFSCFAGTFFAGIDSCGNLLPCREMTVAGNVPLGNLCKDDFMAVWKKPGLRELRRAFKAGARCECWMDRFALSIYLQKFLAPLDRFVNGRHA